jgi:hypothetical protein
VGITPQRSGRASTLRGVEREGPGRVTACCESGVASRVVSEPGCGVLSVQIIGSSRHNAAQERATVT